MSLFYNIKKRNNSDFIFSTEKALKIRCLHKYLNLYFTKKEISYFSIFLYLYTLIIAKGTFQIGDRLDNICFQLLKHIGNGGKRKKIFFRNT